MGTCQLGQRCSLLLQIHTPPWLQALRLVPRIGNVLTASLPLSLAILDLLRLIRKPSSSVGVKTAADVMQVRWYVDAPERISKFHRLFLVLVGRLIPLV